MNDPYKILNLSSDASEEDVKKAYRELARKYHPDNYAGNPLSELAEEKMKELNEAYDSIMFGKSGGSARPSSGSSYSRPASSGSYSGNTSSSDSTNNPVYRQIRQFISDNNLVRAEELLHQCSPRDAEWYFLMGAISHRKGWYDEALRYYETALNMDPGNSEYGEAVRMMRQGNFGGYRKPAGGEMSTCDCCTSLICADCLCECCGGNLIPCIGCR